VSYTGIIPSSQGGSIHLKKGGAMLLKILPLRWVNGAEKSHSFN